MPFPFPEANSSEVLSVYVAVTVTPPVAGNSPVLCELLKVNWSQGRGLEIVKDFVLEEDPDVITSYSPLSLIRYVCAFRFVLARKKVASNRKLVKIFLIL